MKWGKHPDCCGLWLPHHFDNIDNDGIENDRTYSKSKWHTELNKFLEKGPPLKSINYSMDGSYWNDKGCILIAITSQQEIDMESTLRKYDYRPLLQHWLNPNTGNYCNLWAKVMHPKHMPKDKYEEFYAR